MDDKWYQCELDTLHKLRTRLNFDDAVMTQLVRQLNDMKRAMDNCGVIEMVVMQGRRDRSLRPYLDAYNAMEHSRKV